MQTVRLHKAVLVTNRSSRSGELSYDAMSAWAHRQRIPVCPFHDLDQLARDTGHVDTLIAAGGDGTTRAVAEVALSRGLALAIVPTGTANDFARGLGLHEDLDQTLSALEGDLVQSHLPAALANGKLFLNAATVGVSVASARERDDARKERLGTLEYAAALAKVLGSFEPFVANYGHHVRVPTTQLAIAKGRFYGGGLPTAYATSAADAELTVVHLRPFAALEAAAIARSFLNGHDMPPDCVTVERCRQMHLTCEPEQHVALDGEPLTATPLRCEIAPATLCVLLPAPQRGGLLLDTNHVGINAVYKMSRQQRHILSGLHSTPVVRRAVDLRRELEHIIERAAEEPLADEDADRTSLRSMLSRIGQWAGLTLPEDAVRRFDSELSSELAKILHLAELEPIRGRAQRIRARLTESQINVSD